MEFIEEYFHNLNIYYSLIVYDEQIPHDLIRQLESRDYPVCTIHDVDTIDIVNQRIFVCNLEVFGKLLFSKNNDISQFTVIFCVGSVYSDVVAHIKQSAPSCSENVLITKI